MFTGIIQEIGIVKSAIHKGNILELTIKSDLVKEGLREKEGLKDGSSISVNGACLTIVKLHPFGFTAEVVQETLERTTLGKIKVNDKVNLELPLRLNDRLDGHLVLGHIDGIGIIRDKQKRENNIIFSIEAPTEISKYIVYKGSIAIDGISLTIASVKNNIFTVSIIPETIKRTILNNKNIGDKVNIETDIIGKYVSQLVNPIN